ncbi:MAG TPA: hypothetical protein VMZ00_02080 [Sporichthya sp.]|nr:hypothetical protein [Sporichthya sp.]
MGEVVVNGARLPIRTSVLHELTTSAAEIAQDWDDRAVLTSPVAQMSLSLDALEPVQARRIALAVVAASERVRRSYSTAGLPPTDVEAAAQLAAIAMFVGRSFGV